jgi:hypothetical protein
MFQTTAIFMCFRHRWVFEQPELCGQGFAQLCMRLQPSRLVLDHGDEVDPHHRRDDIARIACRKNEPYIVSSRGEILVTECRVRRLEHQVRHAVRDGAAGIDAGGDPVLVPRARRTSDPLTFCIVEAPVEPRIDVRVHAVGFVHEQGRGLSAEHLRDQSRPAPLASEN